MPSPKVWLQVKIPKEMADWLDQQKEKTGNARTATVRNLIRREMSKEE